MKLAVIIPTYNKKENISNLVRQILKVFKTNKLNGSIIIVDDNSPDGTGKIEDELAKKNNSKIFVIHRPKRLGLGTAHIVGMKYAINKLSADLIMTMDSDFSHNPKYIPDLIKKMDKNDVVIGSRYVHCGGTRKWGIHRKIISKIANKLAKLVLGLRSNDCTAGYRCYTKKILKQINLDEVTSDGYSFLIEMLYHCQNKSAKIAETPIIFVDREFGDTKISKKEIFKAIKTLADLKIKSVTR